MPIVKLPRHSLDDMILPARRVTLVPAASEGSNFGFVPIDNLEWGCLGINGTVNRNVFEEYNFPDGVNHRMTSIDGEIIGPETPATIPGVQGGEFTASYDGAVLFSPNGQFSDLPSSGSRTTMVGYTIIVSGEEYTLTLTVRVYNI